MPSLNIINLSGVIFVQEMKMKKISCATRHIKISFDSADEQGYPVFCPLCSEMFLAEKLKEQIRELGFTPVDEIVQEG